VAGECQRGKEELSPNGRKDDSKDVGDSERETKQQAGGTN